MTKHGARWIGVLVAFSLMAFTSWADQNRGPVRGIQWRWGAGGSQHTAPARELFRSPLFSSKKPWGPNEYLLIGASVVVTVVVIVLVSTGHHHNDDPPHPY